MRRYIVIGPERMYKEVVTDDGCGPIEPVHDVYLVDAPNASKAKWAAYKFAKKENAKWSQDLCGEHPLSGVKVEYVPGEDEYDWRGLHVVAE